MWVVLDAVTRRVLVRMGVIRVVWLRFRVSGMGIMVVGMGVMGLVLVIVTRVVMVGGRLLELVVGRMLLGLMVRRRLLELWLVLVRVRLWLKLGDFGVWIVRLNGLHGLDGMCVWGRLGWVGRLLLGNNLCLGR